MLCLLFILLLFCYVYLYLTRNKLNIPSDEIDIVKCFVFVKRCLLVLITIESNSSNIKVCQLQKFFTEDFSLVGNWNNLK